MGITQIAITQMGMYMVKKDKKNLGRGQPSPQCPFIELKMASI